MTYIAKFNPYTMDTETIQSLATGRKKLLANVIKTLTDNMNSSSSSTQLLIRGPRGMGKSFFLKYLEINFKQQSAFIHSDFVLLPEEQNNIYSPSDFIRLILNLLGEIDDEETIAQWDDQDRWQTEYKRIKDYIKVKSDKHKKYILVVVIENLNDFLHGIHSDKTNRDVYASQFRQLLEKTKRLTIIGATPTIDLENIDGNYNGRLFHIFKRCKLQRWKDEDYLNYFERRKTIKEAEQNISYSKEQEQLMLLKLKAISKFTGGSPRMAVVLTNLLLEDDVISTVNTLFGLIDDLTPYYQDLTKSIPTKSKILFDALIRKGENLSQSELATAVGATQSKIAKAFSWLKENAYIVGKKRSNGPAFSYQVADRIHVLYYQQREINHNKSITPIWLLADFLVAFYQENELKDYAQKYLSESFGNEAIDFAKIYLLKTGRFKADNLPEHESSEEWLNIVNEDPIGYVKEEIEFDTPELKYEFYKPLYKKALVENNDKKVFELAFLLGQTSMGLEQYEESIMYFQMLKKLGDQDTKLIATSVIALNEHKLSKYEESILSCKEALENDNPEGFDWQTNNLKILGDNLSALERYNEAIKTYTRIINRSTKIEGQFLVAIRRKIALTFFQLDKYEKSNEQYLEVLKNSSIELTEELVIISKITANYIFLQQWDKITSLMEQYLDKEISFGRVFGNTMVNIIKQKDESYSFKTGVHLLTILSAQHDVRYVVTQIFSLYVEILSDNSNVSVLEDLIEESKSIFEDERFSKIQPAFSKLHNLLEYLKLNKSEGYLESLDPDTAILIQNLTAELGF